MASRATDTRIDSCSLLQAALRSRGFPPPVHADGKRLLGSSWTFLEPRNVRLKPNKTRGWGCYGRAYLEPCRGFAASRPASLEGLCVLSVEDVGDAQPPLMCCRSQRGIARENTDSLLHHQRLRSKRQQVRSCSNS